jgi:hypothetical protein
MYVWLVGWKLVEVGGLDTREAFGSFFFLDLGSNVAG